MNVLVLGASPKPDRYSNKAIRMLVSKGHNVIPVNPVYDQIEGLPVVKDLSSLAAGSIDIVTVYLGAARSAPLEAALLALKPRRVILNPGAENRALAGVLTQAGIEVLEACTLVMLSTGEF